MLLCYLDESGDEQALRTPTDPPVLVIAGIVVSGESLRGLVFDFLQLKKKFYPALAKPELQLSELITHEIKGCDLRRDVRSTSRNRRRAAFTLISDVLALLTRYNATVVGEIHVKGDRPLRRWVYAEIVAGIASQFERRLGATHSSGMMILDARTKSKNVPAVHRLTTERFRSGGDPYPSLLESPVFGHSDAHVALQIADIVASALLFPMSCFAYSQCLLDNVHLSERYGELRDRFAPQLRSLEHRYARQDGGHSGGIVVKDHLNNQSTLSLYCERPFDPLRRDGARNRSIVTA
ncbi:DUF3800 domain-containing protein [Nocardia camponoti]|uniref:DUF3800 domain-containing protein n=1 Tax=Nocardia camponoti TaxID=1616106 RepID=UPI001666FF0C|nr:DUF3800 domain-containing protein [Nocardia camponoti]